MVRFFLSCGPWLWPLALLAVVIVVLTVRRILDLFVRKDPIGPGMESGLNAILFWGAIAAVLGILGQVSGIYRALGFIVQATEISPRVCAMGLAESFTTTICGLVLFLGSALVWMALGSRFRRRARSASLERRGRP